MPNDSPERPIAPDESITEHPGLAGEVAAPLAAPTTARYSVLAFLCTLALVLYLDRVCIGQAAVPMQRDLVISKTQWGYVLGAFTIAYALFEVPSGWWGDRYGARGVLTRIVLWWSAFTVLTGAVWHLWVLVVVRFLFGAGEAGALPNAARITSRWFPAQNRASAQGWVITSMGIGGALAPIMAAYLIDLVGWRWTFVLFGAFGVTWAAVFYALFRDDPATHPAVNEAERNLISGGAAPPADEPHPPVPWRLVLTSRNVWLLSAIMTCGSFASYMYMMWYPNYLQEGRGVSNVLSGWLAGMVMAGSATGSFLGGYLTDWLVRRTGERRWSRRAIGSCAYGGAALVLVSSIYCASPVAAALLTALAAMIAMTSIASWWAVVTEISGRHVGALFGLMNSMGVPGAFGSQVFFGWFADRQAAQGQSGQAQFDPAFYVYGGVLLLGACCWLAVDATRSAVEPPQK